VRIRSLLLAAVCCAAALALSSCSAIESDTEALMSPPRLTAEQTALHSALSEVAGENYRLIYPKTEDSLSAFIFQDLDGDGEDEAMVFYVTESNDSDTRLNILKKVDGSWQSIYSVSGANSSVESVYFANMSSDRVTVMIGWGVSGGEKDASLYRFTGDKLDTLYSGAYSDFGIVDLDGDGYDEVVLFGGRGNSARMLNESAGKIVESAETEMTAPASSFISVKVGHLTKSTTALFVDSKISDDVYITEAFWLSGDGLQRLTAPTAETSETDEETGVIVTDPKHTVTVSEGLASPPERKTAVLCRDINGDGIMEIPVQSELPGGSSAADSEGIPLTQYLAWDGETSFSAVWSGVADVENGYTFEFPDSWLGFVGASKYQVAGEWRFYLYVPDDTGAYADEPPELLRLRVTSANDYQDRFEEDYFLLTKKGLTAYYGYVPAGSPATYRITQEDCQKLFALID